MPDALAQDKDAPVLVIPRLERWFLRHREGLSAVRDLLRAIDMSERRILIGCNSWAWAYLSKAVDADMVLPEPMTMRAFDGERLADWLEGLADDGSITFRTAADGLDIFARATASDDDAASRIEALFDLSKDREPGELDNDYLRALAAHSRGIPWVAWNLWRRALRSTLDDADDEEAIADDIAERCADDEQTLFAVEPEALVLPERHRRTALLVLQALLVHGQLTREELALVLPREGASNMVTTLVHAGMLSRADGKQLRCRAAAYPAVREGLSTLGFSMDAL